MKPSAEDKAMTHHQITEELARALEALQAKLLNVAIKANDRSVDHDVCKEIRDSRAALANYAAWKAGQDAPAQPIAEKAQP